MIEVNESTVTELLSEIWDVLREDMGMDVNRENIRKLGIRHVQMGLSRR